MKKIIFLLLVIIKLVYNDFEFINKNFKNDNFNKYPNFFPKKNLFQKHILKISNFSNKNKILLNKNLNSFSNFPNTSNFSNTSNFNNTSNFKNQKNLLNSTLKKNQNFTNNNNNFKKTQNFSNKLNLTKSKNLQKNPSIIKPQNSLNNPNINKKNSQNNLNPNKKFPNILNLTKNKIFPNNNKSQNSTKILKINKAQNFPKQNLQKNLTPKITYLTQSDFKNGTYIIKNPGTYILKTDIKFSPPTTVPYSLLHQNRAFHLGFFAAIIIQSKNIILDLNKKKIYQSKKHYLNQRFYSHIVLGSAPFKPKKGPHNFGDNFIKAENVVIKNGFLGLSSHHGVQGNDCENLLIDNLSIFDFEVGGISINGGKNVVIDNCKIGPSFKNVPVNGKYSSAIQIKSYVETLTHGKDLCDDPFIVIRGKNKTAQDILSELILSLEQTERGFLSGNMEDIPKIYKNDGNLPDGSSLYGIVFHTTNPAVKGFNNDETKNHLCSNIKIKNTIIQGLTHRTKEMISLKIENEKLLENFKDAQKDPRGSVFDIIDCTDNKGGYKSNPLGDAQLLVSKYKKCLNSKKKEFRKKHLYHTDTTRDTISTEILNWASFFFSFNLKNKKKNNFICNADQMLHSLKGTIGLRLSGVSKIYLENLIIKNLINKAPYGSKICGQYKNSISFSNTLNGFLGADLRGVSIESSRDIIFDGVEIENLKSENGKVFGVDVMFKSKEVVGDVFLNQLRGRLYSELPNDFSDIPQNLPFSKKLNVFYLSESKLKILKEKKNLFN